MEKTTTTTTTSCGDHGDDHLPLLSDVYFFIQEILVCLPVESLLRFKSVCKSWRQLIQSSFFIDLHTTTTFINSSSSSSKFGTFILQTTEPAFGTFIFQTTNPAFLGKYEDGIKLYMLSSSSSSDGDGDGEYDNNDEDDDDDDQKKKKKKVFKVDDLGFMLFYKDFLLRDGLRMVGSCNGIICLHDPKVMDASRGYTQQHYSNLRDVCLWNPATRHFRILPKSIPIQERKEYFIGFGFDVKTKDYKVLRITPLREESEKGERMCRVQVYSLSTDSWRLLEGINSLPFVPTQGLFDNHGIYLNGSYFFVGRKRTSNTGSGIYNWMWMILSFDFTKEIFTTMQLPDDNCSGVLSYLGDKMAVFTGPRIDYDGGYWYYDIWVLNEQHGSGSGSVVVNKESWTRLHSIETQRKQPYSKPRCISNNGEFALISALGNNKLQLFNLVTKEAKNDFTIGTRCTKVCKADVYKESLVSIMGGGNVLLRWQLPTHGATYKLNLDAPFIGFRYLFGIGLCLTSDTGGCIGVRSLQKHVRDAKEGEALAMLEAIKWAKKLELSPIIIESDSKNVVSFFMEDDHDDDNNSTYWSSEALSLLKEAKLLLNSSEIGSISLKYCSRSCNYVADIAAKLGREGLSWSCKEWTANFPGEMVTSLITDLGLESRN